MSRITSIDDLFASPVRIGDPDVQLDDLRTTASTDASAPQPIVRAPRLDPLPATVHAYRAPAGMPHWSTLGARIRRLH